MEFLRALYILLSHKRLKKIELISNQSKGRKASLPIQFYDLLANGQIQTDEQAAQKIFGKPPDSQYRMLKMRTKQMMLNNIFFLDEEKLELPPRIKKINEFYRNHYAVRMLLTSSNLKAGIELAESTIELAIEYELWEEAISLIRHIKATTAYALRSKKYEEYKEKVEWLLKVQNARIKTENLVLDIETRAKSANMVPAELAKTALEYSNLARKLCNKYEGFYTQRYYLLLRKHAYTLSDNYIGAEKILQALETLYENYKDFVTPSVKIELYITRIYNALYLKEYLLGENNAQKAFSAAPKSRIIWFSITPYYFLKLMHEGKYKEADILLNEVFSHPLMYEQPEAYIEQWKIYQGYCYFANQAFLAWRGNSRVFRINKLLNELQELASHKEGLNAAALLLEVLIFFLNRNYSSIIDRIEGLKKYQKRNLRIKETTRCRLFIDLVQIVVKNYFQQQRTIDAAKETIAKLNAAKLGPEGNIENIEILPFERLWQWILDGLSKV